MRNINIKYRLYISFAHEWFQRNDKSTASAICWVFFTPGENEMHHFFFFRIWDELSLFFAMSAAVFSFSQIGKLEVDKVDVQIKSSNRKLLHINVHVQHFDAIDHSWIKTKIQTSGKSYITINFYKKLCRL